MKKYIIMMVVLLGTFFNQAKAMSYEQARDQALFLTDKMAYELNLTESQYEAAYEINLDYLLGVNTVDDLYSDYWIHRNADLRYVLLDWQYSAFCAASYFYRPLYWEAGHWHFGIYGRYPHRDYFYYGCPTFYGVYRGGHAWHNHIGGSWYAGRGYHDAGRGHFSGMRDGWNRGDYRGGSNGGQRGNSNFSGSRGRQTDGFSDSRGSASSFSGNRESRSDRFSGSRESSTRTTVTRPTQQSDRSMRFDRNSQSMSGRTFTPSRSTTTTTDHSSFSGGSRGGSSSFSTPSRSAGSSFSGGSRGGSSSFSGGSRGNAGGGSRSNGGSGGGRR